MFLRVLSLFFLLLFLFSGTVLPVLADETSFMEKGIGYYYQKNWDEAILTFKNSLKENPQNTLALTFYLVSHLQKGTLEKAVEEIEDLLIDNPRNPVMQSHLGFARYAQSIRKGNKFREDAMHEFRSSAVQEPLSLTHTGLGILYQDQGNVSRAKKAFQKALELNNKDLLAMEYLGQLYLFEERKTEEASHLFAKVLEVIPSYPDANFYLARSYDAMERYEDAIRYYKRTMELDPYGIGRGYAAPAYLGEVYLKQKRYSLASDAFKKALELNPNSAFLKKKLEDAEKGGK